ncbi:hypothetical protein CASFOL_040731 [Castilleja foliolosa]|uniref:Glycine-rich protein n=1 Tax=Castilleja foliolosa TaxID=1961234 RepID=A0ABD3BE02_9LAMI
MALPKCSCIVLMALLISLSICSALQSSEPKRGDVAGRTDGGLGAGDSKWSRGVGYPGAGGYGRVGGGWGSGNGYPGGAGGSGTGGGYPGGPGGYGRGGSGWGSGDGYHGGAGGYGGGGGYPGAGGYGGGSTIPGTLPPAGEPVYCRPINCNDPYTCRGFTLYLNSLDIASYRSQDGQVGRRQHDGDADVMSPVSEN